MRLIFKKCSEEDFEDFYILRSDKENVYWTGYDEKPDKANLRKWFTMQLKRKDRIMFIAKYDKLDEPIGYLYLDIVGNNDIIETGHGVNSEYKGKGIGTKIIKFALDYTKNQLKFINEVHGWIFEENIGSIKNVLKNGYYETKETKEVFLEGSNQYKKMKKYVYKIT
ncbi:GNAT family N-acetyltransferase [Tissierella praeacuta]|uniref:GNAT family N-acetyltransferase n=1 Tax=Tissierella praeacuta TaxID=43131 RepID=UPI00334051DC